MFPYKICYVVLLISSVHLCRGFSTCMNTHDRFTKPVTSSMRLSSNRLTLQMVSDLSFSRAQFVNTLLAGSASLLPCVAAMAAVPSLSEYNVGSGTQLKRNDKPAAPKLTFTTPDDNVSALKAIDETLAMLKNFEVAMLVSV